MNSIHPNYHELFKKKKNDIKHAITDWFLKVGPEFEFDALNLSAMSVSGSLLCF